MTFKSILKTLKKVDYFLIGLVLFFFYLIFVAMGKIIFEIVKNKKNNRRKSFWVDSKTSNLYQFKSSY